MIAVFKFIKDFNERSATIFLILAFCADLAFISLHTIKVITPYINSRLFSLEVDHGYPEIYQYIKFFWIIILLIYVSKERQSFRYCAWGIVFAYFLFDDALKIHERVGGFIAVNLNFRPHFGLRLQDYGEVATSAGVGIVLFSLIICVYLKGEQSFKKASKDMILLILSLVFFGVGVDLMHVAVKLGYVRKILVVIEDGGEMVVVSLILWYVFLLSVRSENKSLYLCDYLTIALKRRFT